MKKILLSALILIGFGTSQVKAQDYLFDNPDNKAHLGVRLGIDIMALQSTYDIYSNSGGFSLGVVYNMPVWKNLFFEPGVSIFYDKGGITAQYSSMNMIERSSGSIGNWGLRIPLNLGYHFDITDNIQIIPFTGPQINLNLSNSTSYKTDVIGNPDLHYNAIDLGWNFGVGVNFQKYYVGIGGTVGMSHYIQDSMEWPVYARRNLFTITLGYNF